MVDPDDEKAGPQIIPDNDDEVDRQKPRPDDSDSHQDESAAEPEKSQHSPGEPQTDRDHEDERHD
jgi:hypothetical protein